MSTITRTRIPVISAMSYGPLGLFKTLVLGFLLGSVAFIIYSVMGIGSGYDTALQMRTWIGIAGGSLALSLVVSAVLNYVLGRRVEQQLESTRKLFNYSNLASPTSRSDDRYVLFPERHDGSGRGERVRSHEVEHIRAREPAPAQRRSARG